MSDSGKAVFGGIGVFIIGILVILFLSAVGIYVFGGFQRETAEFRGETGAIEKKFSSTNRIAAQERFEDLFAEIKSTDSRIEIAAEALAADPDDVVTQQNYVGLRNHCLEVVGDYNAEARKYTAESFRAADLPEEIDQSDAATDCREIQ